MEFIPRFNFKNAFYDKEHHLSKDNNYSKLIYAGFALTLTSGL